MASWSSVLYDLIGAVLIIAVLALIAVIIRLIASAVYKSQDKKRPDEAENEAGGRIEAASPEESAKGDLTLFGADEKTAALIMGIVSFESGLPLGELSFNSIKLID